MFVDPATTFAGNLVFTVPHMDDEVLACGGTIAQLPAKDRIHVIYATDGSRSPVPMFRWMGTAPENLPELRRAEAEAALNVLGVPDQNLYFLRFRDGALRETIPELRQELAGLFDRLQPDQVFIPFRYDRHPDHLALHEAVLEALGSLDLPVRVVEYFVYYRWRLLPGGDVRKLIRPEHLIMVDVQGQSSQMKQRALERYKSQTTRYYPWQDRPILPPERVAEVSRSPEMFVKHDSHLLGTAIFSRLRRWIPLAHWVEPGLKRRKDQMQRLARSGLLLRHARNA